MKKHIRLEALASQHTNVGGDDEEDEENENVPETPAPAGAATTAD